MKPGAVEGFLDDLSVFQIERHEQLARALGRDAIRTDEKRLQHGGVRFVVDVLEELVIAREQLPTANAQPRHAGIGAVTCVADHVAVAALELHHDRRLFQSFEVLKHVAHLCRALEIERFRRELDSLLHPPDYLISAAVEKEDHFVDHRAIFRLRLQ